LCRFFDFCLISILDGDSGCFFDFDFGVKG